MGQAIRKLGTTFEVREIAFLQFVIWSYPKGWSSKIYLQGQGDSIGHSFFIYGINLVVGVLR